MSRLRWTKGAMVATAAGLAHANDPDSRGWATVPPGAYAGAERSHRFYTNGNRDNASESLNLRFAGIWPIRARSGCNITESTYVGLCYLHMIGGKAAEAGAFAPDSGMSDHQSAVNVTTFFKDH